MDLLEMDYLQLDALDAIDYRIITSPENIAKNIASQSDENVKTFV